jgi:hypothetical protein
MISTSNPRTITGVYRHRLVLEVCVPFKIKVRIPNDIYCIQVSLSIGIQQYAIPALSLIAISSCIEFHVRFYAWRIYKCGCLRIATVTAVDSRFLAYLSWNSEHGQDLHPNFHRNSVFA